MGVDCSMILRDDSLCELKTFEERMARIQVIEDYLVKKYGITNREEAIKDRTLDGDRYPSFDFKPYDIVSINMYDGFWEIETGWRYSQYFDKNGGPSGLQKAFYDIARDFGCDEAYICSEFCAWNGGDLEDHHFDEWLEDMRSRFGEIRELTSDTRYHWDSKVFPEVVHDSFTACKEKMADLSKRIASKGYKVNKIYCLGWYFITVSKKGKVYLMNKETLELLIPEPIDYFMDMNCSSFEIVSRGKYMLYTSDGRKIFETEKGHFFWMWDSESGHPGFHNICVFNSKSGQAVLVVTEKEKNKETNEWEAFKVYYLKDNDKLIHRAKY